MRLAVRIGLVVNRAHRQLALERLFDFGELDVIPPQPRRVDAGVVGALQVFALTATGYAEFPAAQGELEGFRRDPWPLSGNRISTRL